MSYLLKPCSTQFRSATSRSPAGAQETRLASHTVSGAAIPVSPTIDDARRLFDDGKWKDARRAYDAIVERAITDGEYEPPALEGRAQIRNASLHVPRIKALLKSPVVADGTRAMIAKRLG